MLGVPCWQGDAPRPKIRQTKELKITFPLSLVVSDPVTGLMSTP